MASDPVVQRPVRPEQASGRAGAPSGNPTDPFGALLDAPAETPRVPWQGKRNAADQPAAEKPEASAETLPTLPMAPQPIAALPIEDFAAIAEATSVKTDGTAPTENAATNLKQSDVPAGSADTGEIITPEVAAAIAAAAPIAVATAVAVPGITLQPADPISLSAIKPVELATPVQGTPTAPAPEAATTDAQAETAAATPHDAAATSQPIPNTAATAPAAPHPEPDAGATTPAAPQPKSDTDPTAPAASQPKSDTDTTTSTTPQPMSDIDAASPVAPRTQPAAASPVSGETDAPAAPAPVQIATVSAVPDTASPNAPAQAAQPAQVVEVDVEPDTTGKVKPGNKPAQPGRIVAAAANSRPQFDTAEPSPPPSTPAEPDIKPQTTAIHRHSANPADAPATRAPYGETRDAAFPAPASPLQASHTPTLPFTLAALAAPNPTMWPVTALRVDANDPAVPVAGLAIEIVSRAQDGLKRFEIRLDPPELGRIDVRLDVDQGGKVTSRLMVERADTLDLLRRDAPQLERALQHAGLNTEGGLEFSLRDQSFANREQAWRDTPAASRLIIPDDEPAAAEAARRGYGRLIGLGGGVDIRV